MRRILVGIALVTSIVTLAAAAGSARSGVHGGQHFIGVVNGNHTGAVLTVACPGPTTTGHPAAGQFVAAIRVASGSGATGSGATAIRVTVDKDPSAAVDLAGYGVAGAIPTSLVLPCSGTGTVTFAPLTGGKGAVADSVKVRFINPAA
jgi:hypothetical protein